MTQLLIALLITCAAAGCGGTGSSPAEPPAAEPQAAAQPGCEPEGGLNFVCGLRNPEDLVPIPGTRWLLASGMAAGAGLTAIDTQAKTTRSLFADGAMNTLADARFSPCPGPLDPKVADLHGLSLRAGSGQPTADATARFTLYATNHGGRESIEVFDIQLRGGEPMASWVGCVPMAGGLAANSVAAFTDGAIVATVVTMPGRTFEELFAGRPTGAVFMWTPGSAGFRQLPGAELAGNNGIETSPDDREFYVAASGGRQIVAFSRTDLSMPLRTAQLTGFAPDNVRFIEGNRLITAGMIDDEPECGGAPRTAEGIRCSRGYIVATIDPQTMVVTELARGPRTPAFTGHAIAIPVGNELWLGSFNADRVAYRTLR